MSGVGPYMNEDGDWWVPVESAPLVREARRIVTQLAFGKVVYRNQETVWLDDEHEGGCDHDCPSNHERLAWHFKEVE